MIKSIVVEEVFPSLLALFMMLFNFQVVSNVSVPKWILVSAKTAFIS